MTHRITTQIPRSPRSPRYAALLFIGLLGLGGCATDRFSENPPAWSETLLRHNADIVTDSGTASTDSSDGNAPSRSNTDGPRKKSEILLSGTGRLVRTPPSVAIAKADEAGDIKLNFQNANLLEVVKVIMADMLGLNYTVDPAVKGTVSMQTTRGLRREDLIPTLEMLLRMNEAALIRDEGLYRIVPLAKALTEVRAPQLGDASTTLPPGYSVKVVPLKYISAREMAEILDPFLATESQLLRVDSNRNLLIIASASGHMENLLDLVSMFDVDRMAGMSVGLFTPDFVDVKTLSGELEQLLSDPDVGLMAGLVRFIPIERLNGLIVVATRPEHLRTVRDWVRRLDRASDSAGQRLFVYRVQHGKASELAKILGDLFREQSASRRTDVELAPGLKKTSLGEKPRSDQKKPGDTVVGTDKKPTPETGGSNRNGVLIDRNPRIQIIADEPNNALLILATASEYRQILAALRQLDINPMQVLIEVTIAEISLTDKLSYGVEWFFRNHFGSKVGVGTLDLGTAAGIAAPQPSFSYALQAAAGTPQAILSLLARESNLSVISSPTLLVLNNEEATIQVGDEVPISVQQQQATNQTANIVNSIEYRETGIVLKVKPRINSGGLVFMDVEQEASKVPDTSTTNTLTPRISQRKIKSSVAVHSGDTIILGGLIQDNRDRTEAGVPFFHKLPIVGGAFGRKEDNKSRTELIVLITPHAVKNRRTALQVTETFRRRLQQLIQPREPETNDQTTMKTKESDLQHPAVVPPASSR